MSSWQGKVVLVTGVGSGIGRALALQFATLGAKLIITDIQQKSLLETEQQIQSQVLICKQGDVSDQGFWTALAQQIQAEIGYVDALVNNAGISNFDFFDEMPQSMFDKVMAINFNGVVLGCRHILPLLEKSSNGMLVNLASVFSLITMPMLTPYHASKFAVRGFTESLRQEMRYQNKPIDVMCVLPGGIKTNISVHTESTLAARHEFINHFEQYAMTSPEKAAMTIIKGMQRRKRRILIGPDAALISVIVRIFPQIYYRVINPFFGVKKLIQAVTKS